MTDDEGVARRWWVAGLAATAAAATLIAVPLLRPPTAAPVPVNPPVVSTQLDLGTSDRERPSPSSTSHPSPPATSAADGDAPTVADVRACRTDTANSPPRSHPFLLCFFVVPDGTPPALVTPVSTSPGALVIGVVDPDVVDELQEGLAVHSAMLCLETYPLWVVSGDLGRRSTSGCLDGNRWQKDIDDLAGHIHWAVVDSAELCGGTRTGEGRQITGPVRMVLLCRPGAPASVLSGSAARAVEAVTQLPSVGTPCAPTGWNLITVVGLRSNRAMLPTVEDASGCHLTPRAQAMIDGRLHGGGVIVGSLQVVGGPAPGSPRSIPGDIAVHLGTTAGGEVVATATTDSDGRFSIDVAAGSYNLTGTSPMIEDGRGVCRSEKSVTIREGQTVTGVHIYCSIR